MIVIFDEYKIVLQIEYGITAENITPEIGGWAASSYKAESGRNTYFLKVYDKKRSGTPELLGRLDLSMKITSWLESNTALYGRIIAPILSKRGNIKVETKENVYLLI